MFIKIFKGFIAVIATCILIYTLFWIAKNTSYFFFYEDLVIKTIQETVKSECLK